MLFSKKQATDLRTKSSAKEFDCSSVKKHCKNNLFGVRNRRGLDEWHMWRLATRESADFQKQAADFQKQSADFQKQSAAFQKQSADFQK